MASPREPTADAIIFTHLSWLIVASLNLCALHVLEDAEMVKGLVCGFGDLRLEKRGSVSGLFGGTS